MPVNSSPIIPPAAALPLLWRDQVRKALVIGIDQYLCPTMHKLSGCRNDAELMSAVLRGFGYGTACLTDQQATRANILGHLAAILNSATPDDDIVIAWSGHGSRFTSSQIGMVECLVPHDSFRDPKSDQAVAPNRDITDREIYGFILLLSEHTRRITLLIDACRAGGIVRDLEVQPRGVEADFRKGAMADKVAFQTALDSDLQSRLAPEPTGEPTPTAEPFISKPYGHWLPPSDRYVLLAACQHDEFCREMTDPSSREPYGIFTHHLAQELRTLGTSISSWRELEERTNPRVQAANGKQRLQLEGAIDRQVFGGQLLRPEAYAPVVDASEGRLRLGHGAVHGLTLDSVWAIHPAGSRRPQGVELARARVWHVGPVDACAHIEPSLSRAVTDDLVGARAFEIYRPLDSRLRLLVADPELRGLVEAALRSSASLALVSDPRSADLVLHRLEPRNSVSATDPVPGLGRLPQTHWVIVDRGGLQVIAPRTAPKKRGSTAFDSLDRELVKGLVDDAEKVAHLRFVLGTRHPAPERSLSRWVKIEMRRRSPRVSTWQPVDIGGTVYLGDHLGLRITPVKPKETLPPIFVAVLDLGLSSAITPLYPRRQQRAHSLLQRPLEIGFRSHDVLRVGLPEGYPFAGEASFESAQETVKVLLTSSHSDFDALAQDGVSVLRGGDSSPLAAILDRALDRPVVRSTSSDNLLHDLERWGIVDYPFTITAADAP